MKTHPTSVCKSVIRKNIFSSCLEYQKYILLVHH